MIYTIQCDTGTPIDAIQAALARAPADEVALTFPLGVACAFADAAELEALWAHCQALGMRVVVIGGDQALRAHAVAAGFAAATSVDEWETVKHRAVRRHRRSLGPQLQKRPEEEPAAVDIRVVRGGGTIAEEGAGDLYDLVGEDPPGYVADLVASDETLAPVERQSQIPTIPLQRGRITRRLEELRREAAAAEALDRAQQEYEDQITRTIRTTSATDTTSPPTAAANPADPESKTADQPADEGKGAES
jgi:hypothetical protein